MKIRVSKIVLSTLFFFIATLAIAQNDSVAQQAVTDTSVVDTAAQKVADLAEATLADEMEAEQSMNFHQSLKKKFVEGSAGFMSLVALTLVLGLAFCIERIIYLTLSDINAKKFMQDVEKLIETHDYDGAKQLCRDTRGPVASICYQGILHISEPLDAIERSITSYGNVQIANLEKGCSWITMFIRSFTGIFRNSNRNGDVVRPDTRCRRYQPDHCGCRHESSSDYHYFWNHCSRYPTIVLQLYPLKD